MRAPRPPVPFADFHLGAITFTGYRVVDLLVTSRPLRFHSCSLKLGIRLGLQMRMLLPTVCFEMALHFTKSARIVDNSCTYDSILAAWANELLPRILISHREGIEESISISVDSVLDVRSSVGRHQRRRRHFRFPFRHLDIEAGSHHQYCVVGFEVACTFIGGQLPDIQIDLIF